MAPFVFYFFSSLILVAGILILISKNIVRTLFLSMICFFSVAVLYLLLQASFISMTHLLIYVGGILVVATFGIMLTKASLHISKRQVISYSILTTTLILIGLLSILIYCIVYIDWGQINWLKMYTIQQHKTTNNNTFSLGVFLTLHYSILIELIGILLLIALIGAVCIADPKKINQSHE